MTTEAYEILGGKTVKKRPNQAKKNGDMTKIAKRDV